MIIDTHCHLDDIRYMNDIDEVIKRAIEGGVGRFIIPAADPKTLSRAAQLSEIYPEVYFATGVHPSDAKHYDRVEVEQYIGHQKCVAVGECGLDYHRLPDTQDEIIAEKKLQKDVFIDQIELAKQYNKPLIVHIRDASNDALDMLEHNAGKKGGVLHCYNADHQLLRLANKNFYFGIGGVLTFKNARKLVEVYPRVPNDKLLIETDAPYLTPHPHRGERNEPYFCNLVASKMSELSGMSEEDICELTTNNSMRLFWS